MIVVFVFLPKSVRAQTAEVTLSGATWTAQIGDQSVYTGSNLGDAIRKASSSMNEGTIHIRNPGTLTGTITPKANQTFDFHENKIDGGSSNGFAAKHVNGITIMNWHMTGGSGTVTFNGCSDIHLHNIVFELNGGNGVRVDDDRYATKVITKNLQVTGGIRVEGTRGHAFETYGIDGIEIDRFVARNAAYCGLILNQSKNVKIGYVNSYRSPSSGGYAGFRTANTNGPNVVVDTLIATECARGYFSVSKSTGTTINYVEITGSTTQGMLIQNAQDTHILGGFVWNNNCAEAIRFSTDPNSSGGYLDCKNNSIENVRVFDDRGSNRRQTYGIFESSDGGRTSNNTIRGCDLRDAGSSKSNDCVLEGQSSEAIGTALTGDAPILPDGPDDPVGIARKNSDLSNSVCNISLNHFGTVTDISYYLSDASNLQIHVYTLNGVLIQSLTGRRKQRGHHHFLFNASNLPSCTYFMSIRAGSELVHKKLVVMK